MAPVKKRRAPAVQVEPAETTGLSKPRASERLRGLLRQQKALLTKIKQEQKQRERLTESARDTMTAVMSKVQPLLVKRQELSLAIHRLFHELLSEGRLAKRSRRKVEQVYSTLREVLDAGPDCAPDSGDPADEEHEARGPEGFNSSPLPGAGRIDKASVRDVFRRLALALHPDRATNEEERRRRTEVMKHLSQAYEAGDLAALLEAEQRWLSGAQTPAGRPDFDAQCSALERALTDLKDQLRLLRAEVKELKRSPAIAMAQAMKQRMRGGPASVLRDAVEEVEADLDQLRELLTFVTAFRDQKLSLAEFMRGPPSLRDRAVDLDDLLFDFLEEEFAAPPRRGARRGRGAQVPF